jgi:AbrB family looped-hinge helix DNA binding protein
MAARLVLIRSGILPIDVMGKAKHPVHMQATITSKRQVTFPAAVLEQLGVAPGDRIELVASPEGYLLRAKRVDHAKLAPLRNRLKPGTPPFDLNTFRQQGHEKALRD